MAVDPICGMKVRENSPLRLMKDQQIFYFCSEHCRQKFARQHHLNVEAISTGKIFSLSWCMNKVVIVTAALALLCFLSFWMSFLVPFRQSLLMYGKTIWWAILLGLTLGGAVEYFVPREYISNTLARPKKRTILYSVILGALMSVCSHGVLAISMELHKKGASTPSVVAFLLSSPWANLPLTLLLIGFFGFGKAMYIILSAVVIAIITGLIFQFLESRGLVEKNKNIRFADENFSIRQDFIQRFQSYRFSRQQLWEDAQGIYHGAISLSNMVLWWILLGTALASLSAAYIPPDFLRHYMGPTALGLMVTLLVATIIEVCSEGTAPLAFEIFRQTGALGNSFVFLMAGVVTDYTEIGLIWQNIGRKAAIWLPVVTVPQVLVLGIIANMVFR